MIKVERCSDALWDELARRDATCTFFQTRAWHSLVAPYAGGAPFPLRFECAGGQAVLPLLRCGRLLWDFHRSPFGTYTALLCPDKLPAGDLHGISRWLGKRNVELFSPPHTSNPTPMGSRSPNATYVVDLAGLAGDPAAGWAENQKRHLGKASRSGITVRLAASEADVEGYLGIYAAVRARWGGRARGRYPDSLFHSIWRGLKDGDSLRFWLAEAEGRIVGGYICFYHNRHAVQWQNAVHPDRFASGANQSLLRRIIGDAAERGFPQFDMNPSGGLEGVENFKRSFGTRRIEFENYASLSRGYALMRGLKSLLGRRP
jgi:hypothetical protein